MRILIVERDIEEINGIEWYLKKYLSEQVEVKSVINTQNLEENIEEFQPNTIIIETELINSRVQSILKKFKHYIITVTSSPIFQQAIRAIEVRAIQLFVKPIPLEKLKSTLLTLPVKQTNSLILDRPQNESNLYYTLYLDSEPNFDVKQYIFAMFEPDHPKFILDLYNWFNKLPIFKEYKVVPLKTRIVCLIKSENFVQVEKQLRILIQEWSTLTGKEMNIAVFNGEKSSVSEMYQECRLALMQKFYKGYGHIFKTANPLPITRLDPLLTPEEQQLWINSLENGDIKSIKEFCYRLTDTKKYYHLEDVKIHLTSILAQVRRFMMKYQLHEQTHLESKYRELFHSVLEHPILYDIVQEIILFTLELIHSVKKANVQGQGDYVEICLKIIGRDYKNPYLSLSLVANELNISSNYLSNIFSKKMGVPFKKYLQQYRVQHSEKLLSETNLAISEIAIEVGFIDSNYFAKVFKEHYNSTPLKYRKYKQK